MINILNGGGTEPEIIMSDCAEIYSNLSKICFPNSKHIFCIWHVYRAWANKLRKIYHNKEEYKENLNKIISIQKMTIESEFIKKLDLFINTTNRKFSSYFKLHYMKRISKWAAYNRVGSGINVNMYLESFHRFLKRDLLSSKFKHLSLIKSTQKKKTAD